MPGYISPDKVPSWVTLCGILAPLSSITMYLSPIPTIRSILRTGTVGDLPLLPYSSMVASCFAWIVYGVLKGEPTIYWTNCIEFTFAVYYFVEFSNYAPASSPTFPGSVYQHMQGVVAIGVLSLWIAIVFQDNISRMGDLTVLLTVLTFASPLAAVKAVVESQSSESIPWPFTLAALFNCCLWTVVGIWEMHDVYVYSPALVGLVFALVQVIFKLYFGDHHSSTTTTNKALVEMDYPLLERIRQLILLGNHGSRNTYTLLQTSSTTTTTTTIDDHDDYDLHWDDNNTNAIPYACLQ